MKYARMNKTNTHDVIMKAVLDEVKAHFDYETYRGDGITTKAFILLALNVQLFTSATINTLSVWCIFISIVAMIQTIYKTKVNWVVWHDAEYLEALNEIKNVKEYQNSLIRAINDSRVKNKNIHNQAIIFYNIGLYSYLIALFNVVIHG